MKNYIIIIALLTALFSTAAYAADGGVAVVNLDKVAKELGVLDYIQVTLDNKKFDLDSNLSETQKQLQSEMNKALAELGDKPSDEEKREVIIKERDLQVKYQNEQAKAMNALQQERVQLINEFRDKLKPMALEIAQKRNLHVVLNLVTPVYTYSESVDITDELAAEAKKAGMSKTAPAPKAK